ncbi:MAG: filamentous hemagglutinin N-terminal domain-containing protein, partial [Brasilonema sp.]
MRINKKAYHWSSGLVSVLTAISLTVLTGDKIFAQITPDDTLGSEGSIITPNVDVKGLPAELIEGGATRGVNLFHSFLEFNIGEGQRAYFANPVQIENILSRVTGNNLSNILGTLGVLGNANLFFINPNGILFGPNAQLDIRGSFVASTANSIVFNNGLEFSATNPGAPPLLAVNITPGLQYGTNHPGATITNAGTLAVEKDLTLSADSLDLQGQLYAGRDLTLHALDTVRVRDSALAPFMAAAGGQLLLQGNQSVDIFALNHPNSGLFSGGNMVLRSANTVGGDAHYWSGGHFRIENLDGSLGNLYSPYDPIIRSRGDVTFNNYFGASLHILAGGSVNINTVTLISPETGTAGTDFIQEKVQLSDGTPITINGSERATLDIRAGMNQDEVGSPGVTGLDPFTDSFFEDSLFPEEPTLTDFPMKMRSDIAIKNIEVLPENGLVFLTNKYKPNTLLDAGSIKIGSINQENLFGGGGDSIYIDAIGDISLTRINADGNPGVGVFNNNSAFGGHIVLLSEANIHINGEISSSSESNSLGKGGDIRITADSIFLAGGLASGAAINTRTVGKGNAGNVLIKASNTVMFNEKSNVTSEVNDDAQGNAGNIEITSRFPTDSLSIEVKDGASLV